MNSSEIYGLESNQGSALQNESRNFLGPEYRYQNRLEFQAADYDSLDYRTHHVNGEALSVGQCFHTINNLEVKSDTSHHEIDLDLSRMDLIRSYESHPVDHRNCWGGSMNLRANFNPKKRKKIGNLKKRKNDSETSLLLKVYNAYVSVYSSRGRHQDMSLRSTIRFSESSQRYFISKTEISRKLVDHYKHEMEKSVERLNVESKSSQNGKNSNYAISVTNTVLDQLEEFQEREIKKTKKIHLLLRSLNNFVAGKPPTNSYPSLKIHLLNFGFFLFLVALLFLSNLVSLTVTLILAVIAFLVATSISLKLHSLKTAMASARLKGVISTVNDWNMNDARGLLLCKLKVTEVDVCIESLGVFDIEHWGRRKSPRKDKKKSKKEFNGKISRNKNFLQKDGVRKRGILKMQAGRFRGRKASPRKSRSIVMRVKSEKSIFVKLSEDPFKAKSALNIKNEVIKKELEQFQYFLIF